MASRTMHTGDTYPPLKGSASDEDGLVSLTAADALEVVLKKGNLIIELPATPIDPPEIDGDETYNWEAPFEADDTDEAGTYTVRLVVTWDDTATPPSVESFPNSLTGADILIIESA